MSQGSVEYLPMQDSPELSLLAKMRKNLENWYLSHFKATKAQSSLHKKWESLHVLESSCRLLKSNLAMQVFPTHDCMRGHSCLVEASGKNRTEHIFYSRKLYSFLSDT